MYEHKLAYRHGDGTVEGFVGTGPTKPKAKEDAIEQVKRKVDIVAAWKEDDTAFDKSRVIVSPSTLAANEIEGVQEDWRSGVRY